MWSGGARALRQVFVKVNAACAGTTYGQTCQAAVPDMAPVCAPVVALLSTWGHAQGYEVTPEQAAYGPAATPWDGPSIDCTLTWKQGTRSGQATLSFISEQDAQTPGPPDSRPPCQGRPGPTFLGTPGEAADAHTYYCTVFTVPGGTGQAEAGPGGRQVDVTATTSQFSVQGTIELPVPRGPGIPSSVPAPSGDLEALLVSYLS